MTVSNRTKHALTLMALCGLLSGDSTQAQELKLTIGNPVAAAGSTMLKKGKAAFVVRLDGCSDPKFTISGTVEGLIGADRKTDKAALVMVQPGVYAVERTFPEIGSWVVDLTASCQGRKAGAIVPIVTGGFKRETTKYFNR